MERTEATGEMPPIAGALDAAVARLPEDYRTAVLLRFYRGLDVGEISRELGISDAAARKRVERGIGHLRRWLGVDASPEGLATAAIIGKPAHLSSIVANVTQGALQGGSASAAATAKGAAAMIAAAHIKIAIAVALVVLAICTGAVALIWENYAAMPLPANQQSPAPLKAKQAVSLPIPLTPEQQAIQQTYWLKDGESVRWVKPPFIKERALIYLKQGFTPANGWTHPLGGLFLDYHKEHMSFSAMYPREGNWMTVRGVVTDTLNLSFESQNVMGDQKILNMAMPGDIVQDRLLGQAALIKGLEKVVADAVGTPVTIEFRQVQRPTIVFWGKWKFGGFNGMQPIIDLNWKNIGGRNWPAEDERSYSDGLASRLGDWLDEPVVIEAQERHLHWHYYEYSEFNPRANIDVTLDPAIEKPTHDVKRLCDHIAEQTGLSWHEEPRSWKTLVVERVK
jgi:hypothetical protein